MTAKFSLDKDKIKVLLLEGSPQHGGNLSCRRLHQCGVSEDLSPKKI